MEKEISGIDEYMPKFSVQELVDNISTPIKVLFHVYLEKPLLVCMWQMRPMSSYRNFGTVDTYCVDSERKSLFDYVHIHTQNEVAISSPSHRKLLYAPWKYFGEFGNSQFRYFISIPYLHPCNWITILFVSHLICVSFSHLDEYLPIKKDAHIIS